VIDILDAVSLAGSRLRPNEDAFGAAFHRAWVIDGATSLGDSILPGPSDAAWIAARTNFFFLRHVTTPDTRDMLSGALRDLQASFARERLRKPEERWEVPFASFLMLTAKPGSLEAVWLGDCRCLTRDSAGERRAFGATRQEEAAEAALAARFAATDGGSGSRTPEALALLREQRSKLGTPDHPTVLMPDPSCLEALQSETATRTGQARALLMTDGFSALGLRYHDVEDEVMISTAVDHGLAKLATRLRHIEADIDPAARRFPRWKRSDDATALLVDVR